MAPSPVKGLAQVADWLHVPDEFTESEAAQLAAGLLSGRLCARDFRDARRLESGAHARMETHATQH